MLCFKPSKPLRSLQHLWKKRRRKKEGGEEEEEEEATRRRRRVHLISVLWTKN
jgi:hypothetical protein